MKQKLRLVTLNNNVCPYCVDAYNEHGNFWQQVSKNYFHKGWAVKFMKEYQQELINKGFEVEVYC